MKKHIWFAIFVAIFSYPFFVLAALNHAVISQIQVSGDNGADDEFIEIYNPTDQIINLQGWSVQYKSYSGGFPLSYKKNLPAIILPAQNYYLLTGNAYNGSIVANLTYSAFSLSGASNGATIFLSSSDQVIASVADSAIVDRVGYGSSVGNAPEGSNAPLPASEQVLMRVDDTDNNAQDFKLDTPNPRRFTETSAPPDTSGGSSSSSSSSSQTGNTSGSASDSSQSNPTDSGGTSASSGSNSSGSDSLSNSNQNNQSEAQNQFNSANNSAGGSLNNNILTKSNAIKITEIFPNPTGEDAGKEQAELENLSSETVNLNGWYLGDKTDSGVKSNAFMLENLTIGPNQVLTITIPKGKFALNNSGGDTLNLYFGDKILADSVAYPGSAPEGQSYQKINTTWVWTTPTLGQKNPSSVSAKTFARLEISEFMPNLKGQDEGKEWVELYNPNDFEVSSKDYILDDEGAGKPGSSAWKIDREVILQPKGFAILEIPEDKFSLDNTGKDTIRLFDPAENLLEALAYSGAEEDVSYIKMPGNNLEKSAPTPGKENVSVANQEGLIISEMLPHPQGEEEEFLEIYNSSATSVNLKGLVVKVGEHSQKLATEKQLGAGEYFVFYEKDLPRLVDKGDKVEIVSAMGKTLDAVSYPKSVLSASFAKDEDGKFYWSANLTPGAKNQIEDIVLASATEKETEKNKSASTSKTKSVSSKASVSSQADVMEEITLLRGEIAQFQETILAKQALAEQNPPEGQVAGAVIGNQQSKFIPKTPIPWRYLVLMFFALGGFGWVLMKYIKNKGLFGKSPSFLEKEKGFK